MTDTILYLQIEYHFVAVGKKTLLVLRLEESESSR